jgi:transglutaminase-like putative cysteine protease
MKTQKAIAMVMIVAGSVLVAAVFRDIAFPAVLCMLGLLGLQRRFTWHIQPERRVITSLLLLLLAILFAAHYTYAGLAGRVAQEQAAIVAWATIARYFLASMILILFLGSRQRLPPSLGLFYMATVVSAGQVLLLDDLYAAFRLLEALSVILIVLYAAPGGLSDAGAPWIQESRVRGRAPSILATVSSALRSRRTVATGLILLLAVNVGWIVASVLYRHVELLNYMPVWLWRAGSSLETPIENTAYVGFSTSGELSSILAIKGEQDTTVALRILSDSNPGYLRARAFDLYGPSTWVDVSHGEAIEPTQKTTLGGYFVGRMNQFRLSRRTDVRTREMMVRHESRIPDAMFTPLGTQVVEAPLPVLMYDDDGIVSAEPGRMAMNYRVTYADPLYAPPPAPRPMLNVPAQLDPRVRALADRIFAGCTTTAEKIKAVVDHFQANYTYSLGLTVPPGRDKLEYFLLEASTGYCEYFASGAAILLRLADVRTRYVTGFLVTERDPDGQGWVARNMDAHAWVEAWDEESRQWVIVEATVREGLAAVSKDEEPGGTGGLSRYLLLGGLLDYLYEYGLFGVLAWALQFYGLPATAFLLATTFAGISWWLYARARARHRRHAQRAPAPEIVALHKLLARMDRCVRPAGLRRGLDETLQVFAQRLLAKEAGDGLWTNVSNWYLEYADLRYSGSIAPERLHRLQHLTTLLQP